MTNEPCSAASVELPYCDEQDPDSLTLALHHERLANREERHMMLGHWKNIVDELARAVEGY